jgi:hypothetical protein
MLPADLKQTMKGFVWIGPSAPHPVQSSRNPTALPLEGWQGLYQGFRDDRVGFTRIATPGVFGVGAPEQGGLNIDMEKTKLEFFEQIVRMADARAIAVCLEIVTGTAFWQELQRVERPILVLHGDGDAGESSFSYVFFASHRQLSRVQPHDVCMDFDSLSQRPLCENHRLADAI